MSTSNTAITFNGSSTYAGDFQQVIARAVGIASLPMQSLQSDVTKLTSQQATLASLDVTFSALHSAVLGLDSAANGNLSASVSNSSAVTASVTQSAFPGTYKIQVDDPGSSTVTLGSAGSITVADPSTGNISSATSFTLTVNGTAKTITPSGTSMVSLATAINAANDGVQATIVNVGSGAAPDYRLAVTSTNLGGDTIQLNDGTNDLLDTLSTGTDALYKVNGSLTQLHSTTSQVTLSPGLTVNLLAQSASPVTITVAQDFSALYSGLNNLVSAYNSAFDALAQNRGQAGGALTGDSIVSTLGNILNQVAQFTSSSGGAISTLTDLGISLDQTGHLSFDQTAFAATNSSDLNAFFGTTAAPGFLQAANDEISSATDSVIGILPADITNMQAQITAKNTQITNQQAKVTQLQNNLQQQLSQADAAIATLQSQKTYFQELFTAEYGNGANGN